MSLVLVYERDGERIAHPIPDGEMFIGRKDYCELCFPDASVSKRHVKIVREGSSIQLHDAGSRNGTLVNGRTVDRCELSHGDVIQVGKITLTVAHEGSVTGDSRGRSAPAGDARGRSAPPAPPSSRGRSRPPENDSFKDFDDFDPSGSGRDRAGSVVKSSGRVAATARPIEAPRASSSDGERAGVEVVAPVEPVDAPVATALFTVVAGAEVGRVFELVPGQAITLGTKEENGVPLQGEGISRYHAEVTLENGVWILKDLGSRNGTFVGGRKVDLHELAPGDEVQIGTVRLRFDQKDSKPATAADPRALLLLIKQDPAAFLRSPAGRQALMILVGVVLLFVILTPPPQQTGPEKGSTDLSSLKAVTHDVLDLLDHDQASKASDMILKAQRQNPQGAAVLRDLGDLAKIWDQHTAPLTFEWKAAGAAIDKVIKSAGSDLDEFSLDWLKKAAQVVGEEEPNHRLTVRAAGELVVAGTAANEGRSKDALDAYKRALELYKNVPIKSVLRATAQAQAKRVQANVFRLLVQQAERMVTNDPPPWPDAVEVLKESLEFADSAEDKAPVRRRMDEFEANQRDEDSFARAVDIVQQRVTAKYDEALRLLGGISKTARVYPDAQTYMHWIGADRDVRAAKTAYDQQDWDRAKALLLSALKVTELGPDAKASVTRRLELWGKVVNTFNAAKKASEAHDYEKAQSLYSKVLETEPNPKNRYRFLADDAVRWIETELTASVEAARKEGLELLARGKYRVADEKFKYVKDTIRRNKDAVMKQIRDAVAKVNGERRLLASILKRERTDENLHYDKEVLETLHLLGSFLPKTDPDYEPARKTYTKLNAKLDAKIQQALKSGEDD